MNVDCRASNIWAPSQRTVPKWLTSKTTASFRQARCSVTVPVPSCQGHLPAAEGDELGAEADVHVVEERASVKSRLSALAASNNTRSCSRSSRPKVALVDDEEVDLGIERAEPGGPSVLLGDEALFLGRSAR